MRVQFDFPLYPLKCKGPTDYEYWYPLSSFAETTEEGLITLPATSICCDTVDVQEVQEPQQVFSIMGKYYARPAEVSVGRTSVLCKVTLIHYEDLLPKMRIIKGIPHSRVELCSGNIVERDDQILVGWVPQFIRPEVVTHLLQFPSLGSQLPDLLSQLKA